MTPRATAALWMALGVLFLTSLWLVGRGPGGLLFLPVYAALVLPGLPLGFALFGRRRSRGFGSTRRDPPWSRWSRRYGSAIPGA